MHGGGCSQLHPNKAITNNETRDHSAAAQRRSSCFTVSESGGRSQTGRLRHAELARESAGVRRSPTLSTSAPQHLSTPARSPLILGKNGSSIGVRLGLSDAQGR